MFLLCGLCDLCGDSARVRRWCRGRRGDSQFDRRRRRLHGARYPVTVGEERAFISRFPERGYAKLFDATCDAARAKGYEKLFGFVRADNDAGLRTYLGQGFRIIGTAACHAKIGGAYIDEVLIEKWLMPSRAAR